ncbi:MAG: hypothetical protein PHS79_00170 [Patescibacteria group bacterium]|nr:hypothetical protein [Patescibacteria group bacterium]
MAKQKARLRRGGHRVPENLFLKSDGNSNMSTTGPATTASGSINGGGRFTGDASVAPAQIAPIATTGSTAQARNIL